VPTPPDLGSSAARISNFFSVTFVDPSIKFRVTVDVTLPRDVGVITNVVSVSILFMLQLHSNRVVVLYSRFISLEQAVTLRLSIRMLLMVTLILQLRSVIMDRVMWWVPMHFMQDLGIMFP